MTSYVGDRSISDADEREFGLNYYSELVEYIANDLSPDQVYTFEALKEWVDGQDIDDLYHKKDLEYWAEHNGFVLE